MTRYMVVTPEYEVVVPTLDDGSGPMEPTCDVLEVEASNAREAKIMAVREWRRMQHDGRWRQAHWIADQQSNGASPFTGLQVINLKASPQAR